MILRIVLRQQAQVVRATFHIRIKRHPQAGITLGPNERLPIIADDAGRLQL